MTYPETLDFLYSRLPMFHRVGGAAYKADLSTTIDLAKLLGNPQIDFPSIHIAGTNGKGSTSNILASILMEAGFKTALFTSPHLTDFRERIRVDGKVVPEQFVIDFVRNCTSVEGLFCEDLNPSFFELTFAMAMLYFSQQKVDIAVVEVGMGGRLDSTNIINSILTVITNIGLDHTAFLGDSIEKIAYEKGGIIKNNIPIVIGKKQKETIAIFKNLAGEKDAPIYFSDDITDLSFHDFENYGEFNLLQAKEISLKIISPLRGNYQKENLKTAIAALNILSQNIPYQKLKDWDFVKNGIENVIKNTDFKGRWQEIAKEPLIICDTGHNIDGLTITMTQITAMHYNKLHMVIGMVNDKDIKSILQLMPLKANYYFCSPNIPRGLEVEKLKEIAHALGLVGLAYFSVEEALAAAKLAANFDDLIFIGGSTFVVAEVV